MKAICGRAQVSRVVRTSADHQLVTVPTDRVADKLSVKKHMRRGKAATMLQAAMNGEEIFPEKQTVKKSQDNTQLEDELSFREKFLNLSYIGAKNLVGQVATLVSANPEEHISKVLDLLEIAQFELKKELEPLRPQILLSVGILLARSMPNKKVRLNGQEAKGKTKGTELFELEHAKAVGKLVRQCTILLSSKIEARKVIGVRVLSVLCSANPQYNYGERAVELLIGCLSNKNASIAEPAEAFFRDILQRDSEMNITKWIVTSICTTAKASFRGAIEAVKKKVTGSSELECDDAPELAIRIMESVNPRLISILEYAKINSSDKMIEQEEKTDTTGQTKFASLKVIRKNEAETLTEIVVLTLTLLRGVEPELLGSSLILVIVNLISKIGKSINLELHIDLLNELKRYEATEAIRSNFRVRIACLNCVAELLQGYIGKNLDISLDWIWESLFDTLSGLLLTSPVYLDGLWQGGDTKQPISDFAAPSVVGMTQLERRQPSNEAIIEFLDREHPAAQMQNLVSRLVSCACIFHSSAHNDRLFAGIIVKWLALATLVPSGPGVVLLADVLSIFMRFPQTRELIEDESTVLAMEDENALLPADDSRGDLLRCATSGHWTFHHIIYHCDPKVRELAHLTYGSMPAFHPSLRQAHKLSIAGYAAAIQTRISPEEQQNSLLDHTLPLYTIDYVPQESKPIGSFDKFLVHPVEITLSDRISRTANELKSQWADLLN